MNNDINEKIVHAAPVPPFVRFVASAVPMVFDNSLSYYEALCALWKWMQDNLVDVINNNATVTEHYIELDEETRQLFIELKSYVDNYFDNLDVQEEINNKLDAMAEDGTLQEIITDYIQSNVAWCFDTVADMKLAENLTNGSYAQTLGFHSLNDGGGAIYKITDSGTANEMDIIAIGSLRAHLICSEVNVLQFGAYGDNTHNDGTVLQACANYAKTNALNFYMPNKTFLSSTFTIDEVKIVKIEGTINLAAADQSLNIFESTNDYGCNIYVNRVNTGSIIMKGLNTADVRIQRASTLTLMADNTDNHHWIAYSKFYLGFINILNIEDDGSGTRYVNENLYFGGRFARINIGSNNSTYLHEQNRFMSPLCEGTTINFEHAKGNTFTQARLEGNCTIIFSENSYGNTIDQEWSDTKQGYYLVYDGNSSTYDGARGNITVNDYSEGQNRIVTNQFLNKHSITNVNIYNNPFEVPLSDDGNYLYPLNSTSQVLYKSNLVPIPNVISCLIFELSDSHLRLDVQCYDENKTLITSDPGLKIFSPTLVWENTGTYRNSSYTRKNYWLLMDPALGSNVKYIRVMVRSLQTNTRYDISNVNITLTSYGYIPQNIIEGLSKPDLS